MTSATSSPPPPPPPTYPSLPFPPPPPSGYPPPPYPLQYPHFYPPPCKCELASQIRYYNHRDREFYYHTAVPTGEGGSGSGGSGVPTQSSSPVPGYHHYYDPFGPYAPPGSQPYYYNEAGLCELILVLLALLLWLYSFYRLYLVWQNTLNFSESSIQGPQGWDLLVSWIVERIRIKKLRVLTGMSTRRPRGQHQHHHHPNSQAGGGRPQQGTTTTADGKGIDLEDGGGGDDMEMEERCCGDSSSIDLGTAMGRQGFECESAAAAAASDIASASAADTCSVDMGLVSNQRQLKLYLASYGDDDLEGGQRRSDSAGSGSCCRGSLGKTEKAVFEAAENVDDQPMRDLLKQKRSAI